MTKCEAGKCLNITKCSQWHLPPFSHAPFLLSSPTPSTHTSHLSGKLSDKVALERLTRKFLSSLFRKGGMSIMSYWVLLATSATYWSDRRTSKYDVMIPLGCWLPRYVSLIKSASRKTLLIFSFFFLLLRPLTFLFTTCISSLESLKMWFILFTGTWWTKNEQRSRRGNNRNTCYNTRTPNYHSQLLQLMCQFLKLCINGWGWRHSI